MGRAVFASILAVLSLADCEREQGPTGPQGPKGEQGEPGESVSFVIYTGDCENAWPDPQVVNCPAIRNIYGSMLQVYTRIKETTIWHEQTGYDGAPGTYRPFYTVEFETGLVGLWGYGEEYEYMIIVAVPAPAADSLSTERFPDLPL